MRLTANDRRVLIRRLKERVPPAWLAKGMVPRFVLIVTATLFVTPKAWADLVSGDAQGRFETRAYAKDDLKKTEPTVPGAKADMDERIAKEMSALLKQMTSNIQGDVARTQRLDSYRTRQPDQSAYLTQVAALKGAPDTQKTDVQGFKSFMGLEFQRAARNDLKDKVAAYTRLMNLARFNLKFEGLFGKSGKSDEESLADAMAASRSVRYGLVVQDIEPDKKAPGVASVDDTANEMRYAGHADVKWTIAPLTEASGRKVFEGVQPDAPPPPAPDTTGWTLHVPSPNFHTDASTETVDDYSKLQASTLPNARFELIQDEDFYRLSYRTTPRGQRIGVEHAVKVPVAGTLAMGRRFDDHYHLIETSAYNVLYDKRLPLVSIHQMHIERRWKGEMAHNFEGNHTVSLNARGDATGPVENEAERPRAYSLNYTHTF